MNTPVSLEVGAVVDRYTIERPLGEGGMAMVFKVRHNGLGTSHALKVITLNNAEIRRRLVQEGELQGRLQHANIVSVTDIVELPTGPALVMEFVDGPSLDQLLRARQLTLQQADELAVGLLAGVAAAHARGLVHRDLKPGNI
ncbi:MAG: serine/threonine protein kinase, partial [Myxococcales bacterium]|nr:serine/threonine protein kinase [Myxococcales bacterium]